MTWQERIIVDPKVLVGKPVIRDTRLAVEFIVELLAEGWTQEQVLANYPQLTAGDIQAALHYAAEIMKQERVFPLLEQRARRGSREKFQKVLSKVSDVAPDEADALPKTRRKK